MTDKPAANTPQDHSETALRSVAAHVRLWTVVVVGLAADLWSKEWAFGTLRQGGQQIVIPYVLELHTTLNSGALFGIGAGHTVVFLVASVLALILVLWMFGQSPRRRWLMHVALGAILAGALGNMYDRAFVQLVQYTLSAPGTGAPRYYIQRESPDGRSILLQEYPPDVASPVYTLPRLAENQAPRPVGVVRDFIKIPTRWLGGRELWPWVFNAADMLLVGGVAILAVRMIADRKPQAGPTEAELDASVQKP